MSLYLYDTLTRTKREFVPQGGTVKMYVCGVTPYDRSHLGHAMSAVAFDVLRRYLEYKGYMVDHVTNFTDVDDKIIQRAAQQDITIEALAERYIREYFRDMDALNVLRARIYPRATREVSPIQEAIKVLLAKGYAYTADGDVYFRVRRFPAYGKLSQRALDELLVGSRVEVETNKEDPLDFALWKAARPEEPSWDSPWGPGRPGWHIECSTIVHTYLGESIDIHGGGQDLIFPHHENEIAQAEAATGTAPFVHFWVHNGLLQLGEEKMSKSLGNLVTVEEAVRRFSPDAIRLFFLSSHYRSPLIYIEERLAAMERAAERLRRAVGELDAAGQDGLESATFRQQFEAAMDDDLNTPEALAALFDLAREINRAGELGRSAAEEQKALRRLAGVLGLTLEEPARQDRRGVEPFVELLVETRAQLREAKQYQLADAIRARLSDLGVLLEDTPRGTVWRLFSS